jgi:transcriptional regulator with XRE-family HTH domain
VSLFGETLKLRREERGLDQSELAERLGVTQQSISRWEHGQALPRPQRVRQLAEELGLDVGRLHRAAGYLPDDERSAVDDIWHEVLERMSELSEAELMLLLDRAWEELRARRGYSPPGTI